MDNAELYELIAAYLDDELPAERRQEVEQRMAADDAFREEVALHRALQEDYGDPARWRLREAMTEIMNEPLPPEAPPTAVTSGNANRWKFLALLAVILLAGFAVWQWSRPTSTDTIFVEPMTPASEKPNTSNIDETKKNNPSTIKTPDKPSSQLNKKESAITDLPGFVFVQGGSFTMGSKDGEKDEAPHVVRLNSYFMAVNEVTFDEYDAFCTATKKTKPLDGGWGDGSDWGRGKNSVINISWYDAIEYCNWLSEEAGLEAVYSIDKSQKDSKNRSDLDNKKWAIIANWSANGYRLPTEAEWEFAARSRGKDEKWAGTSTEGELSAYCNFADKNSKYKWKIESQNDGYEFTAPVGTFKANDLGLHDMSGNVWEFCWDWYAQYPTSEQTNPRGNEVGDSRVLRGGGWNSAPTLLRCTNRQSFTPNKGYNVFGFRLVRSAWIDETMKEAPFKKPDNSQKPTLNAPIAQADPADFLLNAEMEYMVSGGVRSGNLEVKISSPANGADFRLGKNGEALIKFAGKMDAEADADLVLAIYNNKEVNKPETTLPLDVKKTTDGWAFEIPQRLKLNPGLYYFAIEKGGEAVYTGRFTIGKKQ